MIKFLVRRRYIVDWKLQGSLVWHGLLYGALVLVFVIVGMFTPLLWEMGGQTATAVNGDRAVVMLYLHERLWPLAAIAAGIVAIGAIALSHRIAGPLVRFKRNLRMVADGQLPPPLRTRPTDYLQEEVECLNAAVAGVRSRADSARRAAASLQRRLQDAAHRDDELIAACEEVLSLLDGFRDVDPGDTRCPADVAAESPRPVLAGRFDG